MNSMKKTDVSALELECPFCTYKAHHYVEERTYQYGEGNGDVRNAAKSLAKNIFWVNEFE